MSEQNATPGDRTAVRHQGHVDFLENGRLIHEEDGRRVEHSIEVSGTNPDRCDPGHRAAVEPGHRHGANCGHEAVPHGDHLDYLVEGRLHHPHDDHVDDHGPLQIA